MTLYWIAFAGFCAIHLTACFLEKEAFRKGTKIFLMPALATGFLLTKANNPMVMLGLFLGWLGDIFLIFTGKRRNFVLGTFFFIMGHFCYIAAALRLFFSRNSFADVPAALWILFGVVITVLFALAQLKISKHLGALAYLGAGYFSILAGGFLLSIAAQAWLLSAAFAIFTVSDITLSICRFAKKVKREHFYIMSTYILAQTLMCISLIYG